MNETLMINNAVDQFSRARYYLVHRLKEQGIHRVSLWGGGPSGELVFALLHGSGIQVASVYDKKVNGDFFGLPVLNPYDNSTQLAKDIPVIITSARKPHLLKEVTEFLQEKGITYFFTHKDETAFLQVRDFHNIHKGKRCFVIGNGPSLNKIDMGKLKNEITIGANRCFLGFEKWGFKTTYWTIEDPLVAEDVRDQWNKLEGPVKFLPFDLQKWITDYKNICLVNFKREPFYPGMPQFSNHPSEQYWGGTVTYLMLQLAVIMGCSPIFLVGIDFHYVKPDHVTEGKHKSQWTSHGDDPNHFDKDYFGNGRKWHDPMVNRMKKAFESVRLYADANGIEIYNATPGTHLDVLKKIDYQTLF